MCMVNGHMGGPVRLAAGRERNGETQVHLWAVFPSEREGSSQWVSGPVGGDLFETGDLKKLPPQRAAGLQGCAPPR